MGVRQAAVACVLACLCRAQSPQESAIARQRESIQFQQEAMRRPGSPALPGLSAAHSGSGGPERAPKPPAGEPLEAQAASIRRQLEAVARQQASMNRAGSGTAAAARIDLVAPASVPEAKAPADAAPESPFDRQLRAAALQPRPSWPEPPSAAQMLECQPLPASILSPVFERAGFAYGVSPLLLRAVAEQESGLQPCAVSRKGALGLMQLMPETATFLGLNDPFDVEENIFGGARFLRQLLDRFQNDLGLALGAYNAGPARIEQFGGIPPIAETQNYVASILTRLRVRPAEGAPRPP
jgi:soluble lytic murein transglycosylase-like protein